MIVISKNGKAAYKSDNAWGLDKDIINDFVAKINSIITKYKEENPGKRVVETEILQRYVNKNLDTPNDTKKKLSHFNQFVAAIFLAANKINKEYSADLVLNSNSSAAKGRRGVHMFVETGSKLFSNLVSAVYIDELSAADIKQIQNGLESIKKQLTAVESASDIDRSIQAEILGFEQSLTNKLEAIPQMRPSLSA